MLHLHCILHWLYSTTQHNTIKGLVIWRTLRHQNLSIFAISLSLLSLSLSPQPSHRSRARTPYRCTLSANNAILFCTVLQSFYVWALLITLLSLSILQSVNQINGNIYELDVRLVEFETGIPLKINFKNRLGFECIHFIREKECNQTLNVHKWSQECVNQTLVK